MHEELSESQLQSLIYNRECEMAGLQDQINTYVTRMASFPPDARRSYQYAVSKLQETINGIEKTKQSLERELRGRRLAIR